MSDKPEQALFSWAQEQLTHLNWKITEPLKAPLQGRALAGDAGQRSYYRLPTEPALLAVFAPPSSEENPLFVSIARYLREQGVHTPNVIAADYERGFMLQEDFGDALYSVELDAGSADLLYGEAMMSLLRLQQCPVTTIADASVADESASLTLGSYDQPRLRTEMRLFDEWFVPELLGYELNDDERALLDGLYTQLESEAMRQPQTWVHRDYHSRNLIYREGNAPGVIDFQGALRGPITYDLVSLLRDCYLRWEPEQVERWALSYGNMAVEVGLMAPVTQHQFLRWFDWMGLQRQLKVLGIFSRLSLRDGKNNYLADLPLVIRYLLEVSDNYVELDAFRDWFIRRLLPLCEQQDWYSDYRCAGDIPVDLATLV